MTGRRMVVGVAFVALLAMGRLDAQGGGHRWSVSGTIAGLFARRANAADGARAGTWAGAGLEAEWRTFSLIVRGYSGDLHRSGEAVSPPARLTDLALRVRPRTWWWVGIEAGALRSNDTGVTSLWRLAGPVAGASTDLGVDGLSGHVEVAFFPVTGVVNDDRLSHALRAEVGMDYARPQRVTLGIAFRRQTFRFANGRPAETLGGLVLSARVRVLPLR